MRWQAGNGQEMDKRVGLFGCSAVGIVNERGLASVGARNAYDIGLSHPVIWLHRTSPTHVCKVHFSGRTPITKIDLFRNSDGASLFQELSKIIKSDKRPGNDYLVVDVRDSDFIGGNIINCRNVPSNIFQDNLDGLLRETKNVPQVIFHCALSQSRWVTNTRLTYSISYDKV